MHAGDVQAELSLRLYLLGMPDASLNPRNSVYRIKAVPTSASTLLEKLVENVAAVLQNMVESVGGDVASVLKALAAGNTTSKVRSGGGEKRKGRNLHQKVVCVSTHASLQLACSSPFPPLLSRWPL
jgi:hypothetical protein